MPLDIDKTRTQLKIVKVVRPEANFLQKTFFPNAGPSLSDTIKIKRANFTAGLADQVAGPNAAHKVVTYPSFSEHDVTPPYIKDEYPVDNEAMTTVSISTGINEGKSPAEIARDKQTDMLINMKNDVYRRIEQMAGQLLTQGKVTLDDSNEITYDYPAAHSIVNAAGDYWDGTGANIIDQLEDWAQLVQRDSGTYPTTVVLGSGAARAFRNHVKENKLFDSSKINIGNIDTKLDRKMGAVYLGQLTEIGIDVWSFAGSYTVGGNRIAYLPSNKIVMGSQDLSSASLEWAVIPREDVGGAIEIFTGVYRDEKLGRASQLLETRPLPILSNPDAFLNAQVIA